MSTRTPLPLPTAQAELNAAMACYDTLRTALQLAKDANSPNAAERIRAAISSAKGAVRGASVRVMHAARGEPATRRAAKRSPPRPQAAEPNRTFVRITPPPQDPSTDAERAAAHRRQCTAELDAHLARTRGFD